MGYTRERTNRHFFVARANAFFSRLPIARIQRSLAMESVREGRMRPWKYTKEQILGAPVTCNFEYNPRPVRLIGTVMDAHTEETSIKGGMKVYARNEETNMMLWIPAGNPKLRHEVTSTKGSFQHYLDERDKWDEAWITGRARIK
uniref:Uncharacterized protein n=1 Tax=Trypanosoma congolense (strain IL3000) TaxID=1068625 RepID=G0UIV6_TRYCI|nr:conserved hypothetical protein [Trypanosoma congolense IL3000]